MSVSDNVFDVLKDRGFLFQCTDEQALREQLGEGPVTLYLGYDATASSLHVGSLVGLMALRWFQKYGHKVMALVGGATTLIGDPTGRTDLRKMLTRKDIDGNVASIRSDIERFVDFGAGDRPATMVNNLDWLGGLNYLEFLRDYGTCFSVNRMIAQESVKQRLDRNDGLTFLEFNYSLLQAFDFMHLNKESGCTLQVGGGDQWGNIVSGVDLARRINRTEVFGLTWPLILTSDGRKMGKSADGAVWLNPDLLSPYDYYQYWVNVTDDDTARFLKLFTELPLAEIEALTREGGASLREAKSCLAFEATALCHGAEAAQAAVEATRAAFGGGGAADDLPTLTLASDRLGQVSLLDLFVESGLCPSRGEAKRLAKGGGARLNDAVIDDIQRSLLESDLESGACLLRAGKKKVHRIALKA